MRPSHKELIEAFEALAIRLIVSEFRHINEKLDRIEHNQRIIMASQEDEAKVLNEIGDRLNKALAELVAALGKLGQTSPEVDAATARLQAAAAALDDLNADEPPPTP